MSTLNHLKKNESLYDKQLVIINSSDRDLPEQTSSSFTYTFNKPIERVSKIDVLYTKIPKAYYNVNSDNATMSITTDTFNEEGVITNLVVNDSEIENGNIEATNLVDGSVNRTNVFMSPGDSNAVCVVTKNTLLYVAGTYSNGTLILQDFTGENSGNPLINIGLTDLFIAQYNLEQVLQFRFRIAGILDEYTINIAATDDYILIAGIYNSYPLTFYNADDSQSDKIVSNGFPNGFLTSYTTNGELVWSINITGVNNTANTLKTIIDEDNSLAYITGSYYADLKFYNKTHNETPEYEMSYIGTGGANVFIAQYDLVTGVLNWSTRMNNSCISKTISINKTPAINYVVVGVEYQDNLVFNNSGYPGVPIDAMSMLELEGTQNICIVTYDIDGSLVNRFRIGGSSIESNVHIDINNNILVVAGLYSSNPLRFYGTDDVIQGVLDINGLFNNIFIAYFDLSLQLLNWATNIYDISNSIDHLDVGLTDTNEVFILGNYSTILKFNSTNGEYQSGKDLLNTNDVNYLFLAKYSVDGKFLTRSYIQSPAGVMNTSIDTETNNVYISGSYVGDLCSLYNPDDILVKTITNTDPNIRRGLLVSYINNINNYTIDNTISRRIICRTLTGSDLNYTLNLNAFSQELGFNTSQKFQAMVFGSSINWTNLDVDNNNDTLQIVFRIGDKTTNKFTEYTRNFKITQIPTTATQTGYSPYNLAFELSKVIRLSPDTDINNTNTSDTVIYDSTSNLFYIIFGINGTFTITANNLSVDLAFPETVSQHCVIADNSTNEEINLFDSTKLSIKLEDVVVNRLFNNVSFSTAFPNTTANSGSLFLNAIDGTAVEVSTGIPSDILKDDFLINDEISFNSPWVQNDINETSIVSNRIWTGSAISSDGQNRTLVASNDKIYTTNDSGGIWQKRESVRKWVSVSMTYDGHKQSAVALNGQIYISDSNGDSNKIAKSWIPKDSNRLWQKIAISKTDGVYQSAVALNDKIYISNDSGNSWLARESRRNWQSIAISNDGIYQTCVAYNDFIYISSDYGKNWSSVSVRNQWHDIALSSNGEIQIAVNRLGSIYKSIDYGTNWVEIFIDQGKPLQNISISSNGVYQTITGNSGNIYTSDDTGDTWVNKGLTESWSSISVSNTGQYQMAVIRNGGIYESTDFGNNFINISGVKTWSGIAMSSDGVIQAACIFNGYIHMSYDSGNTWQESNGNGGCMDIAISADGRYILASSFSPNSYIIKSNDYGMSFSLQILLPLNRLICAAVSATGQYQFCGSGNGKTEIYVSNDYGTTWISQSLGVDIGGYGAISATGKYMLAKQYKSSDYGVTWEFININGYSAAISSDGKYQTMGGGNNIFKSDNYGENWTNTSISGNYTEIAMSANGKYRVATGLSVPFHRSSDFGVTWTQHDIGRLYSGLAISADGKYVAASVKENNLYQSTNFGIAWKQTQLVYADIVNRKKWTSSAISNSGQYMLGAVNNGSIFTSSDNGLTFNDTNIRGSKSSRMSANGQYQVSASGNTVRGSSDFGATWSDFPAGSGGDGYIDISEDGSVVITCTTNGLVYVSDVSATGGFGVGTTGWPLVFIQQAPPADYYIVVLISHDGSVRYAFTNVDGSKKIYKWTLGTGAWDAGTTVTFDVRSADINVDGSIILLGTWDGRLLLSKNSVVGPFVDMTDFGTPDFGGGEKWAGIAVSPDGKTLIGLGSHFAYGQTMWISYNGDDASPNWVAIAGKRIWTSISMSHDGTKIMATEDNGGLYFSFNGGISWQGQKTFIQPSASAIDGTGLIQTTVTSGDSIYTSNNKGATWGKTQINNNWNKIEISTDGTHQTAIPYYGQLLTSTDTGVTWSYSGPIKKWTGISMSVNGSYQTATAFGGSIWSSIDGGANWSEDPNTDNIDWIGVGMSDFEGLDERYAIVKNGSLYRYNPGTNIWDIELFSTNNWSSITVSNDGLFALASEYQGKLFIRDSSRPVNFEWYTVASPRNWYDVAILDNGNKVFLAVSIGGQIYRSTDTVTWVAVEKNRFWTSLSASSNTIVNAVEFDKNVYQSHDSGVTWYALRNLYDIAAIDSSDDLLIQTFVQINGPIFVSQNKGVSFSRIDINREWRDISMSSDGVVQAAAAYGDTIYISTDSGITWAAAGLPIANWSCVSVSKDTGAFITAAATDGQIFRSANTGGSWIAGIGSGSLTWESIDMTSDGSIQIAVTKFDGGSKSINGGSNWTSIPVPVAGINDVSISSDGLIQTIIIQGQGIYQSSDTGDTWSINTTLAARDYTSIDMTFDGSIQILAANDDYIYYSIDFGITWKSTYTLGNWFSIFISSDGSRQLVSNHKSLYSHDYELGTSLILNVVSVNANTVNFTQNTSTPIDYTNIHGFNMSDGLNYSVIRKTPSGLVNIFVPDANYTPLTLVNTINGLITDVNPAFTNAFSYNAETSKISFTPMYSGVVLGLTDLLSSMGFTTLPNPATANVEIIADGTINDDISGPSNIFIKSDIIANNKMHKAVFSNNTKLVNLIAPLELHTDTNTFRVPIVVELFLSKKVSLSTIDIQIVDENGNIVNLNNNSVQINFYFYTS